MGRPGLSNHPKFRRLAHTLGSAPLARGLLELMWEVAYENGDPRLGDPLGVEAAAQWAGERGVFFAAARDAGGPGRAGFIVERDGVWEVHDLYDHAPDYVRKRAKREAERRTTGRTLDAEVRSLTGQSPPKTGQRPENGTPPAPAPAPAQEALLSAVADVPAFSPVHLQALWNEGAVAHGLPRWDAMTDKRRKAAGARIREHPRREWWEALLDRAVGSAFLRGESGGWRMNPDFLLQPGAAEKILEGKYDNNPRQEAPR